MSLRTSLLPLALLSAVAFVVAFISVGVALISAAFALIGSLALAGVFYVVAKRAMLKRVARQRAQERLHSA